MRYKLEHTLMALTIVIVSLMAGVGGFGFVASSAFFFGREHAQAEYRWIEHHGKGVRSNMPWWGGLDPKVWDAHSLLWNLAFPIAMGGFLVLIC